MINYYRKAWKIAGNLRKYQYARLTTILWVLAVIYEFYILITYDYVGLGSLGAIIANIFEAIVITIVLCLLTYVNSRFFPWAKVRLPFQGIDKPVFQDMTESGEEIYRDTLSRGPQATPDFDISTSTTEVEDPEVTPTNVPYSVRQNTVTIMMYTEVQVTVHQPMFPKQQIFKESMVHNMVFILKDPLALELQLHLILD